MDNKNDNNDANSLHNLINTPLPDIDPSGTYWIVKAPTHGEQQPNVIGFDKQFNYLYDEKGQIYCGNCENYDLYEHLITTTKCKNCQVSFKAVSWFDKVTYTIEINNVAVLSGVSYDKAVQYAQENRSSKNNIYVYYEKSGRN